MGWDGRDAPEWGPGGRGAGSAEAAAAAAGGSTDRTVLVLGEAVRTASEPGKQAGRQTDRQADKLGEGGSIQS